VSSSKYGNQRNERTAFDMAASGISFSFLLITSAMLHASVMREVVEAA